GKHVGISGHRKHDSRENGEYFHGEIELVRQKGIIGRFHRFNRFLLTFEDIPEPDIRPDEILKIYFHLIRNEGVVFLCQRFDDGALRFQGTAKIQDISLQYRNFEHHFLFLSGEYLSFDEIQFFADMVEPRETGVEENIEHSVKKRGGRGSHVESALSFAVFQLLKESIQLIDALFVARNDVIIGENDIQFAGICRPMLHIEKGNMDRKKQAVFILHDFRLIRRGNEFFDRQRMDIEVLLEIRYVVSVRIFEIDPGDFFVLKLLHFRFYLTHSIIS